MCVCVRLCACVCASVCMCVSVFVTARLPWWCDRRCSGFRKCARRPRWRDLSVMSLRFWPRSTLGRKGLCTASSFMRVCNPMR
jgi:hypothetical protein